MEKLKNHLREVRDAYETMDIWELKATARAFVMDDSGTKAELINALVASEERYIERMGLECIE